MIKCFAVVIVMITANSFSAWCQCDTSKWVGKISAGGGGGTLQVLNAQTIFNAGILTALPSSSYPNPYYVNFDFKDTFCITNNFAIEVRLKNDPAVGGAISGDTWINIVGSGITAGCLIEGITGAQQYTAIYAGNSISSNLPQLVMNLSTWRTIRFDFIDNVVYWSYDGSNFFSFPYSGSICNIEKLNIGFREAGEVDYIKLFDAYNSVVYNEEFNDCNNLAFAADCLPPDVIATAGNPSYCEGDSIKLTGAANVAVQYTWSGPDNFSSTLQNPVIPLASLNNSGWYKLTGYVNACTPVNKDSVYVTVNQKKFTAVNPYICQGSFYFAGGMNQTMTGIYQDTLTTTTGCDSIITTTLTVIAPVFHNQNLYICEGDSLLVGGAYQKLTGIFNDTLNAITGCDSIVISDLTVIAPVYTNLNIAICEGSYYFVQGANQSVSGTYYDTLNSIAGCDSIVITDLQVISPVFGNTTVAICQGDSFFVGGAFQSVASFYTDTILSIAGCDSILTTELQLIAPIYTNVTITICQGDSFYVGGAFQVLAGSYQDTLTSSAGCDSIITTSLQMTQPVYTTLTINICSGDSIFLGGGYQSQAGIYHDTLQSIAGCDSILTTNLLLIDPVITSQYVSICYGDNYFAGGAFQNIAGIYYDTLSSSMGCDSILVTHLEIILPVYGNEQVSICDGESYFAGGMAQVMSGIYADTLTASTGCDSILVTSLTVLPNPMVYLGSDSSICEGTSAMLNAGGGFSFYQWSDGSSTSVLNADQVGSYSVTVTDQNGCTASDTMQILQLWPLPENFLPADSEVCGKFIRDIYVPGFVKYEWSTGVTDSIQAFTTAGIYTLQVTDYHGCTGSDVIIFESVCSKALLMPNAFTPNGDELNDVFKPVVLDDVHDYELKIFDRWGKLLFYSKDTDAGWDGREQNQLSPVEAYVWIVEYKNEAGEEQVEKGSVSLLR